MLISLSKVLNCHGEKQIKKISCIIRVSIKMVAVFTSHYSIATASANSMESYIGCTSKIYFDDVTLMLHNVRLTSQKHNNRCDCSKTNG